MATWGYVRPEKQTVKDPRPGATLGATRMNNLLALRTCLDNRDRRARRHELI